MPAPQKNRTQHVYEQLRTRILRGEFSPNQQLVNRAIAQQLDTSTIPVREAILKLASEGLLEHRPGDGVFVRHITLKDIEQLYDIREAVETLAAAECARNSTPEILEKFGKIFEEWEKLAEAVANNANSLARSEQMTSWVEFEEQFHSMVADCSLNPWLITILGNIRLMSLTFLYHRFHPELITADLAYEIISDHRNFIKFLNRRDSEGARKWMSQHISQGRQYITQFLKNNPTAS